MAEIEVNIVGITLKRDEPAELDWLEQARNGQVAPHAIAYNATGDPIKPHVGLALVFCRPPLHELPADQQSVLAQAVGELCAEREIASPAQLYVEPVPRFVVTALLREARFRLLTAREPVYTLGH